MSSPNSPGRLQGRTAVVTGAGQGIGRAVAELYAKEGARVAVVDIDGDQARDVAATIRERGGSAASFGCDVADRTAVHTTTQAVAEELGPVEILVNNAGITRPAMLWKMTEQQWNDVIAVHLSGSFHWLQAVVPAMREAGAGRIVFTTSGAGIIGTVGQINYAAAKAGMVGMVRSAAAELASAGITVNAVAPAAATPMTETIRTDERFSDTNLRSIPLRRWADPEEVAATYLFLASSESSYMTGQVLSVDGGRVMMR